VTVKNLPATSIARRRRLQHAWDVIAVLIERDLKVLYKRSLLGIGWALAGPLLQLLIFVLIFRRVLFVPVENYASFVFIGVLVWGWFHASLVQSTSLITNNRALVRQPGFPLALLPHVTVGVRLFHFALAIPFLAGLLWWQGVRPAWSWLSLPVLILAQFALTTGVAYPLAALNVRMRDTQHIVGVALQLLMYLTPIFYSLESVPEALRPWLCLNPMVFVIETWRSVLLRAQWPDPVVLGILAAFAGILLVAGRRAFVAQSHRFVEEL